MRIGQKIVAASGDSPLLAVVQDVEICGTGMEYPLASGPHTFTLEELSDAVTAQDDPAIPKPRIWLGHEDDTRFHDGYTKPPGSAEPAIGVIDNMRLELEGNLIVGDLVGVPLWLAQIMASAFPSRSVEAKLQAETVTGHEWAMVITDLALLGVVWPGVSTLEDLKALFYSDGTPDGVELVQEGESMRGMISAARALPGRKAPEPGAAAVNASVNVEDVRRAYYDSLDSKQAWWWIRQLLLDPMHLIVDDDEGSLYRVEFSIESDEITFGEAVEVEVEYVEVAASAGGTIREPRYAVTGTLAASFASRSDSRPETDETGGTSEMTPEELRAAIGLPADATDEQVSARVAELQAAAQTSEAGTGADPDGSGDEANGAQRSEDDSPPTGEGSTQEAPAAVAAASAAPAALPDGMVAVPADQWEQVQANAASAAQLVATNETTRRDGIVATSIREGRIAASQREDFRRRFDADPAGTERLLTASVADGGLMPGSIPIEARGQDPSADDLSASAYPPEWLPEVQSGATQAQPGRVTQEV